MARMLVSVLYKLAFGAGTPEDEGYLTVAGQHDVDTSARQGG